VVAAIVSLPYGGLLGALGVGLVVIFGVTLGV
jgi:hypothetical protein